VNDGRDGHCDAARTADHQNRVWVDANVDVPLVQDVHDTAWGTSECVIKDTAGHTLYFGERRQRVRPRVAKLARRTEGGGR